MDNESKAMLDTINRTLSDINNRLSKLEENVSLMKPTPVETPSIEVIRRKKINECLEELNFEKIHDVMKMLDWQWIIHLEHTDDEKKYDVPTISYMKMFVKSLLYECYEEMDKNDENWRVSTGGFTVRTFKDNDCEVAFELTSYYTGE